MPFSPCTLIRCTPTPLAGITDHRTKALTSITGSEHSHDLARFSVRWNVDAIDIRTGFLPTERTAECLHRFIEIESKCLCTESFRSGDRADVDVPLGELLRLTVSLSDNSASNVLLRLVGGPAVIETSMHKLDVSGFQLRDGEDGLAKDVQAQYRNWFEPRDTVKLLLLIEDGKALSVQSTEVLLHLMAETQTGPNRMRAGLPTGTVLMHKTVTSGVEDGLVRASNHVGLIELPGGRKLALVIFVTDAKADQGAVDSVIVRITATIYKAALKARWVQNPGRDEPISPTSEMRRLRTGRRGGILIRRRQRFVR